MSEQVTSESRVCPDCDCATLSDADGVLGCTNCGWSEEDEPMDDATRYALGAM